MRLFAPPIIIASLFIASNAGIAAPSQPSGKDGEAPSLQSADAPDPIGAEITKQLEQIEPLAGIDLSNLKIENGEYRQHTEDGRTITFTMDPKMQEYADRYFAQYKVPASAAVMISSRTGRIIALSQERRRNKYADKDAVAFDPSPPAASLFKVITTAALLEEGQVPLSQSTCYAGGARKLTVQHLLDQSKGGLCASLTTALGRSINAIFAKLSDKHLSRQSLRKYAGAFGFNRQLPFEFTIPQSKAEIPGERLERARTSAGFWHTHLTPMHAAMIAQSIAQDGAMLRPYSVDHVEDQSGQTIFKTAPQFIGRTVYKDTARQLRKALSFTVKSGTARKAFHDRAGVPLLGNIQVAGKTGTLTRSQPYRAYSWFIGMAPADNPEVAIAVLVVNEPKWHIKSTQAAAALLKKYFDLKR